LLDLVIVGLLFSSTYQRALQAEAQIGATRNHSGIFWSGMKKPAGFSQAGFRNLYLRFSRIFKAPAS
jgi:hypothetical protein